MDEGIFDEKLGWVFGCVHAGIAGIEAEQALLAGGEDTGFDGAGALEAPAVFRDGLGDIDFEGADGARASQMLWQCASKAVCSAAVRRWI